MRIELRDVRKAYGQTRVIDGVSLNVAAGEFFFLLGPSGCGKTTLLRILAGFIAPDSGEILLDGRAVGHLPPEVRRMPMVFQSYALWPHLSVFENTAYGLRVQRLPEEEIRRRTLEALEATRMADFQDRSPNQLSGGQQQRVAISRAMAVNPNIVLFDEPLSNLDARLRLDMRQELLEIHRRKPFTAVYVTHDQEEAMTMATRMAVLNRGALQQIGAPQEVYTRPANRFVAEFMGTVNWLRAVAQEIRKDGSLLVETPLGPWKLCAGDTRISAGRALLVGFRPGAARLDEMDRRDAQRIPCEILRVQYTGASQRLALKPSRAPAAFLEELQAIETNPGRVRKAGETVEIHVPAGDILIVLED